MPRPDDYPVPSYAAYIWIAGDSICIGFPSTVRSRAHTVRFPNNELGLTILLETLRERARDPHIKFSTKAEPTQYAVERALVNDPKYNEWLKAMAKSKETSAAERAESEAFLKELGL